MKLQIIVLASIAFTGSAIPVSEDNHREPVKRGLFDSLAHFPFLASSSSSHGSSDSSSSSDSDYHDYHDHHHDPASDFHSHSHLIHHPDLNGHFDDNGAISYQNQYFGHHGAHEFPTYPTSYHQQHLFDNHLTTHDFDDDLHKSLLEYSHLDAPEYINDYKNYGGDLGEYSHHAGLLDISDDHKIDTLLAPYTPNHSSYDSY